MEDRQMKIGVWFYGLGTVLTGILNIAWGDFDASHQPIQSLGKNFPGEHLLAYVAGVWLVAAGLAILWRRSARMGAAASAIAYLISAAFWLPRYGAGIHMYGWRNLWTPAIWRLARAGHQEWRSAVRRTTNWSGSDGATGF